MLYPFFVVCLYSIREVLKNRNKKNRIKIKMAGDWKEAGDTLNSKTVMSVSFMLDWGLPLLVTIFVILYLALGLLNYTFSDVDKIC